MLLRKTKNRQNDITFAKKQKIKKLKNIHKKMKWIKNIFSYLKFQNRDRIIKEIEDIERKNQKITGEKRTKIQLNKL